LFYDHLFMADPSLQRMFRTPIEEQAKKLMQVLGLAVTALRHIEELVPVLESMGAKHAAYGVQEEHYDTVGACLLWTLEQGLGTDFTAAVREAWIAAYDLLAGTMKRGAMAAAVVSC
jgi:hemoglobin-like flavoprotein